MITLKLPIRKTEDKALIEKKQYNYSVAFRTLYKRLEETADPNFINEMKDRFALNDIEYRSLKADTISFVKREQTEKENKTNKIKELLSTLDETTNKRKRFKIIRKIAYLKKSLEHSSVFGGRRLLRDITKACNNGDAEKYEELKAKYTKNRIMPFSVMGEANRKGNRFFDFSQLNEGEITYKPQKGVKNRICFKVPKSKLGILARLSEVCMSKCISVSVRLSVDYVYLTYDEEALNGYSINESERRRDVNAIKSEKHLKDAETRLIKECYKKYYDEQRNKKLEGKVVDRCISIDMNPTNIGYSILQKKDGGKYTIIHKGCFDLSRLCRKTGWASSDPRQKKMNNKRKYETSIIVKELFKLAMHFRCSSFIVEDLDIKDKAFNDMSKEENRKNRNIWNREWISNIINRRCNETGICLVEINPCYTSFIGNIQHPYGDSCSASIEIGRRGLFKYTNGMFYPNITKEDIDTLESIFGSDALCSTDCNWMNMYKSLTKRFGIDEFQHRVRTMNVGQTPHSFSVNSYKSGIDSLLFHYL